MATDHEDILDTLDITKKTKDADGHMWVTGTIAGHIFDAQIWRKERRFPANDMQVGRIAYLHLQSAPNASVALFDRHWKLFPNTKLALDIASCFAAGLADHVLPIE